MTIDPRQALFGRTYDIAFEQPATGRGLQFFAPSAPQLAGGDRVNVTDADALQVVFEVDRKAKARSNKARLSITNLARPEIAFIQEPGVRVRIKAGYRNNAEVIFLGEIATKSVITDSSGPDTVTEIEAADAGPQIELARFDRSFAVDSSALQVARAVVDQMGVGRGNLEDFAELGDLSYLSGVAFFGPARDALSEVLGVIGATWSVQDGVLQVLRPGETTRERAVLLSARTGLVGDPKRQKKGLSVTSFLQPQIRPGRKIKIETDEINGFYKITQCQHRGGFRDSDWYTNATCTELGGAQ